MTGEEIEVRFTYHPPTPDQIPRFEALRRIAKDFAHVINDLVPESREQSLAITALEEAVMWANAGIARRET
jgi:hypothetical protein